MTDLEQLNADLLRRRAAQPKAKEPEPEDYTEILSRIKVVSDDEAEKLRKPEFQDPRHPKFESLCKSAGLPKRHTQKDGLDRSGKWGETEAKLIKRLGTGYTCALIGPSGRGKTQLAVNVGREVIRAGRTVEFTTASIFLMRIKETFKPTNKKTELQVIEEHAERHLLIIDEVEKRKQGDWDGDQLYTLINERYNGMLDTILIGNVGTPNELQELMGIPLADRIRETGGVIVCDWPSYREPRL